MLFKHPAKVKVKSLSHVRLLATQWTSAYQAPRSMGFARQEYWSGLPLSSPKKVCYAMLSLSVVSDSVQPHRRQPTRLCCPWDSPGKHTGVGCHFLLQCIKVKSESEVAQSCPTLSDPMDCSPPGSSIHGIFQARVLERGAIAFSETCGSIRFGLRITPQLFYPSNHYQRCTRSHMWSSHTLDTAGPRPL